MKANDKERRSIMSQPATRSYPRSIPFSPPPAPPPPHPYPSPPLRGRGVGVRCRWRWTCILITAVVVVAAIVFAAHKGFLPIKGFRQARAAASCQSAAPVAASEGSRNGVPDIGVPKQEFGNERNEMNESADLLLRALGGLSARALLSGLSKHRHAGRRRRG